MIFLGQASNYSFGRALRHLTVRGRKKDVARLKAALAARYLTAPSGRRGKAAESSEGVERVALYHSGRSALAAALVALAPKGSKVVLPGLTCIAVVRAIRAAGLVPTFTDIDRATLQYDFTSLEKVLKQGGVSAVIVQNTLGLPTDIKQVERLQKQYSFAIVEDLAHSAGRVYTDGREMGTVGAATILSFGKGKAIDTITGGALILRDAQYAMPNQPAQRVRRKVQRRDRWYPLLGWWSRALWHVRLGRLFLGGCVKLGWIERSADTALDLDVALPAWQARLALKQLQRQPQAPLREHAFVRNRAEFLRDCAARGWHLSEIWYDTPVSPARYQKEAGFPARECPQAALAAAEIINLPTWYSEKRLAPVRAVLAEYREIERLVDAGDKLEEPQDEE